MLLIFHFANSQTIDLAIRVGAAEQFVLQTAGTQGYAYKLASAHSPYPAFHLELHKTKMFTNFDGQLGVSYLPVFSVPMFNKNNIVDGGGGVLRLTVYSFQLYTGLEKYFGIKQTKNKANFYSVSAGLGFNLSGANDPNIVRIENIAITKNNEQLKGIELGIEQARYFAPAIYGGIRHYITNRLGKVILGLDLAANIGIWKYYSTTVSYTLDNIAHKDFLSEKGVSVQFGINKRIAVLKK